MKPITLLMTATIDPRQGSEAWFSTEVRLQQYLTAFKFYLKKLKSRRSFQQLLFVDNSGYDLSVFRALIPQALSEHVELLSAPPEIFPAELKKSNEFKLIDYACDHSALLQKGDCFFKVTGRYAILNIAGLIKDVRRAGNGIEFYCDQKDHRLYSRLGLNWCQQNGEMRYIFMSLNFWRKHFYGYFSAHLGYKAVEEIVFDVASKHYGDAACRFRFRHEARFRGYQGQQAAFLGMRFSPRWDYLTSDLRWALAACLRRLFPRWWF